MKSLLRRLLPWILAALTVWLCIRSFGRWQESRRRREDAVARLADWQSRLILEIPGREGREWEELTTANPAPAVRALALEHLPRSLARSDVKMGGDHR